SLITLTETATTLLALALFLAMFTALVTPPSAIFRFSIMTRAATALLTTTQQLGPGRSVLTLMAIQTPPLAPRRSSATRSALAIRLQVTKRLITTTKHTTRPLGIKQC